VSSNLLICTYLSAQVHSDYSEEVGAKIDRPVVGDDGEPDAAEAVPIPGG
jgi:hypothetical protein